MGEVVNLRQARKLRKRSDKAKTAAENRAAFGRTKGEKAAMKADAERAGRALDGARISPQRTTDEQP